MLDIRRQTTTSTSVAQKIRNYTEVVEYLDEHWYVNAPTITKNKGTHSPKNLDRIKQLDAALGHPSQKVPALMVAGTNGKSLTIHLTARLLRVEGLNVGTYSSPHLLTYNERLGVNLETISNKFFTEFGNEVINCAEALQLECNSHELLAMMALLYFADQKVDVALFEVTEGGIYNPVNICHAVAATVTRITPQDIFTTDDELAPVVKETMGIVKKGTWFVSGDQSKNNLQLMNEMTDAQGGHWAMPIRKLAPLGYPYEQIHGRCAALAERLAQMFMEHHFNKDVTVTTNTLLSKQKGKRGRPTLEDKRKAEMLDLKSMDQYWREETVQLPGRFQELDREKPSILLDTASNLDAFRNLLLGIRLLHYKKPLKGLAIIMAASEKTLHNEEFLKLVRYFFKKTSGTLFVCPIESSLPGCNEEDSWNVDKVTNDVKSMKVKARACRSFEEAMNMARNAVDEKQGLIVVTGSRSIINAYWNNKGIKKF